MAEHPTGPGRRGAPTGGEAPPRLIRRPDPLAVASPADFSAALTGLREQAGITVQDLAALVGVSSSTLSGYFAGRSLPPGSAVPVLDRILEACGVPGGPARQSWIDALGRIRRLPGTRPPDSLLPYRGLESFGPGDTAYFFGREVLVARLVALITSPAPGGPVLLVGPSGSGKSSALQAGVAARLRGHGNWQVVTLTPGADPSSALEDALEEIRGMRLPPGSRVALVVDQFEELFTLCPSESDRQAFVHAVTSPLHAGPGIGPALTLVIALSADFYAAALRYEPLSRALQDRQVVVGPMSGAELRRAIAEPARTAGVPIEPGLVELVLHDMAAPPPRVTTTPSANGTSRSAAATGRSAATHPGHDPGTLPLMSYALLETWERGLRLRLTIEDYVAAGGLHGAVAAAAEHVYAQLPARRQEITRELFVRLVAISDEHADTRRPATASDLGLEGPKGDETADVIERFVSARLLITGETTVQIAHEALLAAWPRLRGWLDAEHAGLVTHRRLADAAAVWQQDGRDPAVLHRGGALVTAREWAADAAHSRDLSAAERAFLGASVAARERELRTSRRRTRATQALLVAVSLIALVSTALAVVAFS